jgi:hypothetical protein
MKSSQMALRHFTAYAGFDKNIFQVGIMVHLISISYR